jgi:predicted TPR repeat methyltransferase
MAQASLHGGYLIFNTELTTTTDYILQANGRFAHAQAYVRRIAAASGWRLCHSSHAVMRKDKGVDVIGEFYLFRR